MTFSCQGAFCLAAWMLKASSHMALGIECARLEDWRNWLEQNGIAIESTVRWERGGTSLYFRDPDGNLLELATPGIWANY
jgi:catechol 2,3-dioxygenase-like lactoylglutathione lyase family enzyme